MQLWYGPAGRVELPVSGWEGLPIGRSLSRVSAGEREQYLAAAVEYVWERTCRRFPGCVPAAARTVCYPSGRGPGWPGGGRRWLGGGHAGWPGGYGALGAQLDLRDAFAYPLRAAPELMVMTSGGAVPVDPGSWWWDGSRFLHRCDPCGTWHANTCSPREIGAWWVQAAIGADPPELVRLAAAELAEHLARSTDDPEACGLPDNVASIARRGVLITFGQDRLGLAMVDLAASRWGCHVADAYIARDPAQFAYWQEVTYAVPVFRPCPFAQDVAMAALGPFSAVPAPSASQA